MIFGIGTDMIEVDRVRGKVDRNQGFKEKVFTNKEIEYCESQINKAENFAARFAAKEAFLKALGTGWIGEFPFHEIEISRDKWGKPEIVVYGKTKTRVEERGITAIHLSMTHLKSIAQAVVVLEK